MHTYAVMHVAKKNPNYVLKITQGKVKPVTDLEILFHDILRFEKLTE